MEAIISDPNLLRDKDSRLPINHFRTTSSTFFKTIHIRLRRNQLKLHQLFLSAKQPLQITLSLRLLTKILNLPVFIFQNFININLKLLNSLWMQQLNKSTFDKCPFPLQNLINILINSVLVCWQIKGHFYVQTSHTKCSFSSINERAIDLLISKLEKKGIKARAGSTL